MILKPKHKTHSWVDLPLIKMLSWAENMTYRPKSKMYQKRLSTKKQQNGIPVWSEVMVDEQ